MPVKYKTFVEKVIGGKRYSTETAEHACRVVDIGGDIFTDFSAEQTDLYRTKKGQWFIAGESGAAARWRTLQRNGSSWGAGEGLQLVSAVEAQKLMEDADGPVEDYFDVDDG